MHDCNVLAHAVPPPQAAANAGLRYVSDTRPGIARKPAGKSFRYEAKRNITRAIESVAKMLGNTPAICRKCYVHPAVLDSYLAGQTIATLKQAADRRLAGSLGRLRPEEAAVMMLLRERLAGAARQGGRRRAATLTRKEPRRAARR